MDKLEIQELKTLVSIDKQHVINFLKACNIKVKYNKVRMVFSDRVEKPFKELWELKLEPQVVKVEFTIHNTEQSQKEKLQSILQILIYKICNSDFQGNPNNILNRARIFVCIIGQFFLFILPRL
jgi:hypothetical protein